jgi:autotransporter-associated beta strand protein
MMYRIISGLVLLAALVSAELLPAAPVQWPVSSGGNGHYYEAVRVPGGIDWYTAQANAVNSGGYLATIGSAQENQFVFSLVDSPEFWTTYIDDHMGPWIGGLQQSGSPEPGGGWQWVTNEPFVYANWDAGEPSDTGGNEDRIHFHSKYSVPRSASWNDVPGNPALTAFGPAVIQGYVVEFAPTPSLALVAPLNATIIAGGTGTLGATTVNNAAATGGNLNYALTAAVQAGSATLGAVTPGAGSLTPGAGAANTVSATSTNIGVNTIRFTASDPHASNSPQTINATLTVLDHAAPALSPASANPGRLMRGTSVTPATTVLSNLSATYRAGLQIMGLGGMTGANVGTVISNGGSRTLSAAIDTSTTGKYSVVRTITLSDDRSLSGAANCPSQAFIVNYTVLDDRRVTAPADIDLGYVRQGTLVSRPFLLSTTGDDDHYSRVTVSNSSSPDANGVGVSGGNPGYRFGLDGMSDSRTIGGTFHALGSVDGLLTLTTSGEPGVQGTQAPSSVAARYTVQVYSGKAEWNTGGNGVWGDHGRWKDTQSAVLGGAPGVAEVSGDTATFGNAIGSAAATISLDGAMPLLSAIRLDNASGGSYTIAAGTGGTVTLGNAAADAVIASTSGNHRITAPLVLGSNTSVTIANTENILTISGSIAGPGGLNKGGPGTLVLTGGNSYSGGTTVTAGILQGSVESLPGNLANHGTVVFEQTADATYHGVITGGGGLIKSGTGRLTVAGADTLASSGPIAINAGALVAPLGIARAGSPIAVGNAGTLEACGIVPRVISGTGTVTASGDLALGSSSQPGQFLLGGPPGIGGTLDVGASAVILLSADRAILGSQTTLGDGGSLTTLRGAQLGGESSLDATKVLSATDSATVNGDFINNGLVRGPTAPGQWLTFTQDVKGAGSATGSVLYAGGYSPGNSAALISAETIAFDSTSILTMEIGGREAGSQYDQLNISGLAMLDGTLKVSLLDGYDLEPGRSYRLIAGRTTGGFDQVVGLPAGWHVQQGPGGLIVVPEPSTLALLTVGIIGLLANLWRRAGDSSPCRRRSPGRWRHAY